MLSTLLLPALLVACGGGASQPRANEPPSANAGPDQSVNEGIIVQLAGLGTDPEGGTVTFAWSQVSGPPVTLSSTTNPAATAEVPEVPIRNSDPVVLSLRVSDAEGASSTDTVTINVASTDYVLFRADQDADGDSELHKYDPETDTLLMLSDPLVNGNVSFFIISPDGQWVAFPARDVNGARGLYVAAADGGGVNIINPPASLGFRTSVAWPPDSSQIAYLALNEVFLADPDGGNPRMISRPAGEPVDLTVLNIRWSPDGRYLAHGATSRANRMEVIYCYDTQSGGLNSVRLTPTVVTGGRIVDSYAWAPDSSRIAYRAEQETDEVLELYTVRPDGSELIKLNPPVAANRDIRASVWSPDGSRILYLANLDTKDVDELYTVRPDGSETLKVNGPLVAQGDVNNHNFSWSPDSSRILYQADQDTDGVRELYTVRPDGSENVKVNGPVLAISNVGGSAWSPDSSRILYRADQDADGVFELYTVRPDGSENLKVNGPLVADGDVGASLWSPDSSWIAYRADQETDNVNELYTVRPDASENIKLNGPLHAIHDIVGHVWSPDSSRVLYQADRAVLELYLATPDGMSRLKISGPMDTESASSYTWSP